MKIAEMSVEYVDHMGTDLSVVNAARVSFEKESEWDEELEVKAGIPVCVSRSLKPSDVKLIAYLAKHNHWSPFAHTSVSFRVKAPIFVARQLVKHMVGFSWNEVSRRYVDSEPEFYFPPYWRKRADSVKQGSSDEPVVSFRETVGWHKDDNGEPIADAFEYHPGTDYTLMDSIQWQCRNSLMTYEDLLASGVCPEQARMVLPQNTMTEWIWTGSVYAFARMCNLRLDSHTQAETREIAKMVSDHMIALFPISWKVLVYDSGTN